MIEDTIRAVKEAEAKAETIVADAGKKADGIVRDAEAEAARLIEEAKADAKKHEASIIDKVKSVGEEKLRTADLEAAKEAELKKKQAH